MRRKLQLVTLLALCSLSVRTNAQIYYQDISPDVIINSWDTKVINIDSSATTVLSSGASGNLNIWQEFGNTIDIKAFVGCEVLMNGSYPAALTINQPISSTGTWVQPDYAILNNGTQGNWTGVTDKYLGVRITNGTQWLYGWVRMDVNTAGSSVTIKDYACNRTPDAPVNAGQTTLSGISEPYEKDHYFTSVHPNPFNLFTTITLSQKTNNAALIIYDINGKETKIKSCISSDQIKIDRENLFSGLYFYALIDDNKTICTGKLFIED